MANEGYVSFESILERVNRDKPEHLSYKIADAKEWLWEAVKKVGSENAYIRSVETLKIEDGRVLIPSHVQCIRCVRGERGEILAETYDSLDDDIYNIDKYIINGRYIFTNYRGSSLSVQTLKFPTDEKGHPMIENNIYVIEAVKWYIIHKLTRKALLSGKVAQYVDDLVEKEWLFYVRAAGVNTQLPSMDNMEDWRVLHNMIPGLNEHYGTKRASQEKTMGYAPY